jgi:alpha-1,3-mannosyltransferase
MTLLLALPAIGVILFLGSGLTNTLAMVGVIGLVQVLIGIPFLKENASGYLGRAFELSRQFFFKWTVNWRFVSEEMFLSRQFAVGLLVLHVSVLVTFITTRWLLPSGRSLSSIVSAILKRRPPFNKQQEAAMAARMDPGYIATTILTANVIGLLFARSLHYQFYAYLAWSTPLLLWRSGLHPILIYLLWAAQEWAWNVYPSTSTSSGVVVGVLAVTVAGAWFGTGGGVAATGKAKPKSTK